MQNTYKIYGVTFLLPKSLEKRGAFKNVIITLQSCSKIIKVKL